MSTTNCLSLADWPQADRVGWERALQPADLLDLRVGYAHRWRPDTRQSIVRGYGCWLAWLKEQGWLDMGSEPAVRVSQERVHAYYQAMETRQLADFTVAGRLASLADALKAIGPDHDWAWIQKASSRIHAAAVPIRNLRPRMQPPEIILGLAFDLLKCAEEDRFRTPTERATLFREGLLLGLLIHRPLRMKNVASIDIEGRLKRQGEGWRLEFSAGDMKQKRPYGCDWPADLVEPLERYLEVHRPVLLAGRGRTRAPHSALWISRNGTGMTVPTLAQSIELRTKGEFGEHINPHCFRHITATDIATENPHNVTDIMAMLGHATADVSERHYNLARSVEAGLKYHKVLAERRKGMPRRS